MIKTEQPVNILIVDDKPANLLALEAVLENMGLNMIRAHSGEAALQHFMREDFALILLDVRMPDMDGFETALSISQRDPNRNTPIIFLTAAQENEREKDRAYAVGAIDYLLKPFVPLVLRSKVSVLIDLHRKTKDMRHLMENLTSQNKELEAENLMLKEKINRLAVRRS